MTDTYTHPMLDLARRLHGIGTDRAPAAGLAAIDQFTAAALDAFPDEFSVDLDDPDTHQAVLAGMLAAFTTVASMVNEETSPARIAGVLASHVVIVAEHTPQAVGR